MLQNCYCACDHFTLSGVKVLIIIIIKSVFRGPDRIATFRCVLKISLETLSRKKLLSPKYKNSAFVSEEFLQSSLQLFFLNKESVHPAQNIRVASTKFMRQT